MKNMLMFLRDNRFVHFAVRFIAILSFILYAQHNPTLVFNYVVPILFIFLAIIEIIFAKKLQARRDKIRIARGKGAETSADVRRSTGVMGVIFGVLILCYVFIL